MSAFEIRPLRTPQDWDASVLLIEEYLAGLPCEVRCCDTNGVKSEIQKEYQPPHGGLFLAIENQTAIGIVAIRKLTTTIGELKRLYVKPEQRGRGIARQLTLTAIQHAGGLGFNKLRLDTLLTMHEAISLYLALGWKEIPPYNSNPRDKVKFFELNIR